LLRWFRRPKPPTDERARTQDAPTPAPTDTVTAPPAEPGAPTDPTKKKRRRGSRGGRGRKRPATGAGAATDAKAKAETGEAKPAAKKDESRPERRPAQRKQRSTTRRRTPPRRPPLPPAKRELLISVDVSEQRVAVLEDDKVAEAYLERPERRSIAGVVATGGDTAVAVLQHLSQPVLQVVGTLLPGIPFSRIHTGGREVWFVSKAGGFGSRDAFVTIAHRLRGIA
jgi:hypothetical protein